MGELGEDGRDVYGRVNKAATVSMETACFEAVGMYLVQKAARMSDDNTV
jgi:hypothetical protein